MTTELRTRNAAQQIYNRALTAAWRNGVQVYEPSIWLARDPEAEEKMLREPTIAHAVGYRRALIAGRQWNVVPCQEEDEKAHIAASVGKDLLGHIKRFTDARFNLARAFFSGARFALIHGKTKRLRLGDGKERVWWVPCRLEDKDKRSFRVVPKYDSVGNVLSAHYERWDIARGDWVKQTVQDQVFVICHKYQDDEASLGHGRALRESLGWAWYALTQVFQESLQAAERFGQGMLSAKVDGARDAATGMPNTELIESWRDVLEDLRSRHVMVYDSSDQIEFVEAGGSGWQMLGELRNEIREMVNTLVLGANLPTAEGDGGSRALGEVQENSTEMIVQFDREALEETLTDELIGCLWYMNHANLVELGLQDLKPRFAITQEKRQDPKELADVAAVLHGMGVDLSAADVYEKTGFKQPEPGEEVIPGATAPALSPFGPMPGMGGPSGPANSLAGLFNIDDAPKSVMEALEGKKEPPKPPPTQQPPQQKQEPPQ